ncbi:MAG: hypothetical protein OJF55_002752 [Rhodanobacteraceae bacterium]|jgi:pimeloyl-ACP methyl ester carboxylesterase|nr:MAG: hypothetical protein OJF55_002752 [Rhodanobacteraceae bacterium]
MGLPRYCVQGIAAFGIATLALGSLAQGTAPAPSMVTDLAYIRPARLVDIGNGRRMNLYCIGRGAPTVIFEAGLGDQIRAWATVQPAIAKTTKACSYDRAGLGFSDASGRPGTATDAVDDLHRLLAAASIKPPYVLVGHSLGGLYMQLFADRYRSEVAGMVLVDPVSFDQGRRYDALDPSMTAENRKFVEFLHDKCIPGAQSGYAGSASLFKKCVGGPWSRFSDAFNRMFLANHATAKYMQAAWSEWANVFTISSDEVRAAKRSYGDMPLVVLSRAPFPRQPHETQAMRDAKNYLWVELHDDIAALSTRGVNEIVPGAGHYVQLDKPDVVIAAIRQVVETVQADNHVSTAARPAGSAVGLAAGHQ